jgi:alpha-beta hydrolase superfamily lysophospholipase
MKKFNCLILLRLLALGVLMVNSTGCIPPELAKQLPFPIPGVTPPPTEAGAEEGEDAEAEESSEEAPPIKPASHAHKPKPPTFKGKPFTTVLSDGLILTSYVFEPGMPLPVNPTAHAPLAQATPHGAASHAPKLPIGQAVKLVLHQAEPNKPLQHPMNQGSKGHAPQDQASKGAHSGHGHASQPQASHSQANQHHSNKSLIESHRHKPPVNHATEVKSHAVKSSHTKPLIWIWPSTSGRYQEYAYLISMLSHKGYQVIFTDPRGQGLSGRYQNGQTLSWRLFTPEDWQKLPKDMTELMTQWGKHAPVKLPNAAKTLTQLVIIASGTGCTTTASALAQWPVNRPKQPVPALRGVAFYSPRLKAKGLDATTGMLTLQAPLQMFGDPRDALVADAWRVMPKLVQGPVATTLIKPPHAETGQLYVNEQTTTLLNWLNHLSL